MKRINISLDRKILLALPLVMLRSGKEYIPQYELRDGFYIKKFEKGQEKDWADLEYSVGEFGSKEEALRHFFKEFGSRTDLFCQRCFFLYNRRGEVVGTATAWEDSDFFHTLTGRMHWLSIRPDYQGRGLARPLITAVLNEIIKHRDIIYLTTLPVNFPAIKLYLDFGFFPFMANKNYHRLFDIISRLFFHHDAAEIAAKAFRITKGVFGKEYTMKDILKLVL